MVSDGKPFSATKKNDDVSETDKHVFMKNGDSFDTSDTKSEVRVISIKSNIEDGAIDQLNFTSTLTNMKYVIGLPDLHPGKTFPIGTACVCDNIIYPALVGSDIGCGMAFWKTSIKIKSNMNLEKMSKSLYGLEQPWDGDTKSWLTTRGVSPTDFDYCLGTIGLGNHFAELQMVETIYDEETFKSLNLDEDSVYLLIHSGSRSYGESILNRHIEKYSYKGLIADSDEAKEYLENHDNAVLWAKSNRSLIAHRFMSSLLLLPIKDIFENEKKDVTSDGTECIFDVTHNFVEKKKFINHENELWLHRKGTVPSDKGPVIIPGSRGDYSYLVIPSDNSEKLEYAGYSLAHGAGRKWNRSKALEKMKSSHQTAKSLKTTHLGSKVICERKDLLYEEAPDAYKPISEIIEDLEAHNLIKIVAKLKPLLTYKMRNEKKRK